MRRSNNTSKLRVTGLCEGKSPVTGEFPHIRPVARKVFPFDDVIMNKINLKLSSAKWYPCCLCLNKTISAVVYITHNLYTGSHSNTRAKLITLNVLYKKSYTSWIKVSNCYAEAEQKLSYQRRLDVDPVRRVTWLISDRRWLNWSFCFGNI